MVDDPVLGAPKTERLNMFISKEELEMIDNWAWKNRVRSKSEAIRRLIQIALVLEDGVETLIESVKNGATSDQEYAAALEEWTTSLDPSSVMPVTERLARATIGRSRASIRLMLAINSIIRPTNIIRGSGGELEDAMKIAEETREYFKDLIEHHRGREKDDDR